MDVHDSWTDENWADEAKRFWIEPESSEHTPAQLVELTSEDSWQARQRWASFSPISRQLQVFFVLDPDHETRMKVARNPSLSSDLQVLLEHDPHVGVRRSLAVNRSLRGATCDRLAASGDLGTEMMLARNEGITENAAVLLSNNPDWRVLRQLAGNGAVPLRSAMGLRFLKMTEAGCGLAREVMTGLDLEAREALEPSWDASLDELVAACRSFAA